jgi:hypothetical protein
MDFTIDNLYAILTSTSQVNIYQKLYFVQVNRRIINKCLGP